MNSDFTSKLECPLCKTRLCLDSLGFRCKWCEKVAVKSFQYKRIDFSAFLEQTSTESVKKVTFAYRLYSIAYAPLSLLNMLTVWRAKLGLLIDFYAAGMRSEGNQILDIAIGDGALTALALRKVKGTALLLGLDNSESMLCKAEKRFEKFPSFQTILADARAIPFCKESFSTILCFGGLHVIAHPEEALASIARVLTPNGVLHASVLLKPRGKVSRKLAERYVDLGFLSTIFKFNDIINLVREAGFKVTQTIRNGDMLLLSARLNRSTNFGQGESSL